MRQQIGESGEALPLGEGAGKAMIESGVAHQPAKALLLHVF
jgi:hypothetical protein